MQGDLVAGGRLLLGLPRALRRSFDLTEAHAILRRRLETRGAAFLALARRAVYAVETSPYRALLAQIGCEYGDLERLVGQEGVEGALGLLCRQGVYLTVDEFKGRRPIVRGQLRIAADPSRLWNPLARAHVQVKTSGSRGSGASIPIDLAFVRDHAVNTHLTIATHDGTGWQHAHWGIPGGAALVNLIEFAMGGRPPARWFSQVEVAAAGLHPRYRWSAEALRWGGRLAGVSFPRPEHVPLRDALPIARWMARTLRAGGVPHLWTYASSAVRVCQAARDAGLELPGAQFTAGGEPTTAARLAVVRQVGARAWPRYGSTETDIIAYACHRPAAPDDMHLLHDRRAVVQAGSEAGPTIAPSMLLFTSLLPTDPLVLLNVSLGDRAVMTARNCGCPMAALGWFTHLHSVRSDEKLTAGGMTFLDIDVVRVLEETLPARFGGGPTQYQLLETEDASGAPRLWLIVDPAVGPLDESEVVQAFLDALGEGPGAARVMVAQWRQAGLVGVRRAIPRVTRSGKVLHLHQEVGDAASARDGAPV